MDTRKNETKKITLTAACIALSLLVLWLGSTIEIGEYVALSVASVILLFALIELSGAYPYILYFGVAVFGFLLLPSKTTAILYVLFAGLYPLFKFRIDKLPKVLACLLKLLWFNAVLFGCYYLFRYVFLLPDMDETGWLLAAFFLLFNLTFLLYDYLLRRLVRFYFYKIQPKLGKLLK